MEILIQKKIKNQKGDNKNMGKIRKNMKIARFWELSHF